MPYCEPPKRTQTTEWQSTNRQTESPAFPSQIKGRKRMKTHKNAQPRLKNHCKLPGEKHADAEAKDLRGPPGLPRSPRAPRTFQRAILASRTYPPHTGSNNQQNTYGTRNKNNRLRNGGPRQGLQLKPLGPKTPRATSLKALALSCVCSLCLPWPLTI